MADDWSIWFYNPSLPLAIVGTTIYAVICIAISYLTLIKHRAWYFIPVLIGAVVEVAAYAARIVSLKNEQSIGAFVATSTMTVMAPVFIAAGNYMLITRLILAVLPASRQRVLRISGRWLTPIFVCFDIIAASVQGNGAGIAGSNDWQGEEAEVGTNILIAGLSFQLVAFSLFLSALVRFHMIANRGASESAPAGWRKLVMAIYISSVFIMVRCIFRVAEFAEGIDGYALQNEWPFWVFEAVPMAVAIGIFCFYHPSNYLGVHGRWKLQRVTKASESANALEV